MTAPTPEQIRALAGEGDDYAGLDEYPGAVLIRDLSAALRAAADQLEAANSFDDGYRNGYRVGYSHAEGKYCATADNQENRDD